MSLAGCHAPARLMQEVVVPSPSPSSQAMPGVARAERVTPPASPRLRAKLARYGFLYARPHRAGDAPINPTQSGEVSSGEVVFVESVSDQAVRLRLGGDAFELLAYADVRDLEMVVKTTTRLGTAEQPGSDDTEGIFVRAGTLVTAQPSKGRQPVALEGNGLTIAGTLPLSAIDRVYAPDDAPQTHTRELLAHTRVELRDGRLLLHTGPEKLRVDIGERDGDRVAVIHRGWELEVRGWVSSGSVGPAGPPPRWCYGGGSLVRAPVLRLQKGTRLHAAPGGLPIGRVDEETPVTDLGALDGGHRIRLHERRFRFDLWIADPT